MKALPPDLGEDSAVQIISGDGFQIVQGEAPVTWSGCPPMAEQIQQQEQEKAMRAMIPDRMSVAGQHMMDIPGMRPVEWKYFGDVGRLRGDRVFAIVEQRCIKQCGSTPSPENEVVLGSALVVWSDHYETIFEGIEIHRKPKDDSSHSGSLGRDPLIGSQPMVITDAGP
jgi:hypothetical protein